MNTTSRFENTGMSFDIIGDIHGHARSLERLLERLGYQPVDGVWQQEGRRVLFLGDYIDRGPHPRETLGLVRAMVEAGHAKALMGNHELNAVAYHTRNAQGEPLREHSEGNTRQHSATLKAFAGREDEWAGWIEWFKSLPFFIEEAELRAVHACWCERSIELLRHRSLHDMEFLLLATERETDECEALEMLLKGPEVNISRFGFQIQADRLRDELRVKWWGYTAPSYLLADISIQPGVMVPEVRIEASELSGIPNLALGGTPVFFGHYGMDHNGPIVPVEEGICCLDYGLGKGGSLVAYRWDGEKVLDPSRFVVQSELPCTI